MSIGDIILFAVVGSLAANYVILRLPGWEKRAWLFWLLQGLNLGMAVFMMAEGIPQLPGNVWIFNWVLGLLFILRVVQNNSAWVNARRAVLEEQSSDKDQRKEALKAALAKGEGKKGEDEESAAP